MPQGTKSLVLIIDDPDAPDPKAPQRVWVHWVLYNIPPETKSLPENVVKAELPHGTVVGLTDFKKAEYGGPCPPIGRHRYFHKLYALGVTLDLERNQIPNRASDERPCAGQCRAYRHVSKG